MKKIISLLFILSTFSCSDSEWKGKWGATVGDCDEICTIYYTAQQELMKDRKLNDKDFPDKQERRKHFSKTETGHKLNSWFRVINHSDTTIYPFSCHVVYDKEKTGYVVKHLKIK